MSTAQKAMDDYNYVFDNSGREVKSRFDALSSIFDAGTIRHLEAVGIGPAWRCLEVGAGGGSIASWLCDRAGPLGHVVASDIDTRFLDDLHHPNLEVLRHDIRSEPLPEGEFDLVHTRLVLMHLPDREKVLDRMVRALKPGGWIVVEEFDALSLLPDPKLSPCEVRLLAGEALRQVMTERGVELRYGRFLYGQLQSRGLSAVGAEGRIFACEGGSAWAAFFKASYEQLKDAILATGILSEQQFERDLDCLDRQTFMTPSPILWTAWGQV